MSKKHIAIHKHGEDGGFHIDAETGLITTPAEERPVWSEGFARADMAEYTQWYKSRLGDNAPEHLTAPGLLEVGILQWDGVDAEGDQVEIDANAETRTSLMAGLLGISTDADDWEQKVDGQVAGALVDHDYSTHPSTEASLAEVEGKGFEDVEKKAAEG
jgi:hypothetical protein